MAPRYDEAPEVAPQYLPEVHHPPAAPEFAGYQSPATPTSIKREDSFQPGFAPAGQPGSTLGYDQQSAYQGANADPSAAGRHPKKRIVCGCSVVVLVLSIIIAILSAAVIGLAAGTGLEASRANNAELRLASLTSGGATTTGTAPSATSTSVTDFSRLDRNCSSDSSGVSGTEYTSSFFNKPTFEVWCNSDTPNSPVQSLFVGNFDDCMDACASYTFFIPSDFSNETITNQTCAGVSFIPLWTNRTAAVKGTAPGNCYLKPGPQNRTALSTPNIGTECHAAILTDD
ncbi:uncharacterized protein BCR38DRAFT_76399 [Pseudomassariella vexata]|uniref:Apple domain-containing protein n=1 Tax=Pseudomassariella vexata TaxID=1141098 RepID=A0A1Y2DFP1_9PEZI|nr:uncharacterized protein BCR38DRAFT_76399 [Pseudomassariella vexata]ORY58100.1 hypothetical protein BCR38DRAFT_76399 [Pseudomassariella vexata]